MAQPHRGIFSAINKNEVGRCLLLQKKACDTWHRVYVPWSYRVCERRQEGRAPKTHAPWHPQQPRQGCSLSVQAQMNGHGRRGACTQCNATRPQRRMPACHLRQCGQTQRLPGWVKEGKTTSIVWCHRHVKSKMWLKWTYLQNKLADTEKHD